MTQYKLLVVEDDEPFVKIIDLALRGLNFDFDVVQDGEAAIEKINDTHYDLVISDFRLPKMHGLDILKAVEHKIPGCKKILVTAATEEMIDPELSGLHLLGFLKKPLSPIDLRHLVQQHFN